MNIDGTQKSEKGGCFILIAILCGIIIILNIATMALNEIFHQFKENTANSLAAVFLIGIVCFWIYKKLN